MCDASTRLDGSTVPDYGLALLQYGHYERTFIPGPVGGIKKCGVSNVIHRAAVRAMMQPNRE